MNASFHVLEDIIKGFDSGVEGSLIEKFSKRYDKDLELRQVSQLYQQYLSEKNSAKKDAVKKRIEELCASRKFESSGAKELHMSDRRKFDSKMFYKHEEQ